MECFIFHYFREKVSLTDRKKRCIAKVRIKITVCVRENNLKFAMQDVEKVIENCNLSDRNLILSFYCK